MPSNYTYGERQHLNDISRNTADHNRENWTQDEVDLLLTWDRTDDELTVMAEVLERTREACRQRYYLALKGLSHYSQTTTTTTSTTKRTETRWSKDDDEEFPPDWYVRG